MIAEYILRYLASEGKELSEVVLEEAVKRFRKRLADQFMKDRVTKVGGYGAHRATKCVRDNYYYHQGVEGEAIDPETRFKFFMGDLTELGAYALAQLAFEGTPHSIGLNNEFVEIPIGVQEPIENKKTIKGYIDGLLNFNWDWHIEKFGGTKPAHIKDKPDEDLVLEVKSMGAYPFKLFKENGPDDTWGYLGQISVEQRALRVRRFVMLAVEREKGSIGDYVGTYNKVYTTKADAIYSAVMAGVESGIAPGVPPELTPDATDKGLKLHVVCSYCPRKEKCWTDAGYKLRVDYVKGRSGPRPVWYASKNGR